MGSRHTENEKKAIYEKPKLRIIEMKAEEVLNAGCKLDSGGLGIGGTCSPSLSCYDYGTS